MDATSLAAAVMNHQKEQAELKQFSNEETDEIFEVMENLDIPYVEAVESWKVNRALAADVDAAVDKLFEFAPAPQSPTTTEMPSDAPLDSPKEVEPVETPVETPQMKPEPSEMKQTEGKQLKPFTAAYMMLCPTCLKLNTQI